MGRMTNKKSSSFEKARTWQPYIANACMTEHVGTLTEYSNGGRVQVEAHAGATPGGLADALEKLVAERKKTGRFLDVKITITNLNGFADKSGSCPHSKPIGYQENMERLLQVHSESATRTVLFIGG